MKRFWATVMATAMTVMMAAAFSGGVLAAETESAQAEVAATPKGKELEALFFEHFRTLSHEEQLNYFYGLVEVMVDPAAVEEKEKAAALAATKTDNSTAGTATVTTAAADPQRYVDPATGRVFVYDETLRDWRQESGATQYVQPQQSYEAQQYPTQRQPTVMDKIGSFLRGY